MVLEIGIVFLLILANGVFSMSEMAIVTARKNRLQQSADSGNAKSRVALNLAQNPNQFLAAVQIGITLVGILAGTFGGATIAEKLQVYLNTFPLLSPYSELFSVGFVVLIITYLSLIVGELVPKRLALNNPERIASIVAPPMQILSKLTSPVVRLLDISTDVAMRVLRIKPSAEPVITMEEIKSLIAQGTASGIFEETEQDMIENVLRLDERPVGAWMTPRTKIVWLDVEEPLEEIQRKVVEHRFSRFPVAKDDLDNIIGVIRAKDWLAHNLKQQLLDLEKNVHLPLFIPESMSALDALELFRRHKTHIALVTDEYGSIVGMITHNDILDDIVDSIAFGEESAEPQLVRREDGSWLVDGLIDIDTLKDVLKVKHLPDEEDRVYHTLGGLIMSQLHGVPTAGQYFEWHDLRFEVVDMDGRRVDKVLITPLLVDGDSTV